MRWLINDASLVVGQLFFDPLQYFSWWVYAGAGVVYTALSFSGELSKKGALIFSKQNARSLFSVFAIHASFLVILLGLVRVASLIYPFLPDWMTDLFSDVIPSDSAFDFVFIIAMIGLSYVERWWLYVESGTESHDREPTSTERSAHREE